MSTAATQQAPIVPPRPSRTTDKDASSGAMPKIPPRPAQKRFERSVSPNPNRFAPSPLSGGVIAKAPAYGQREQPGDVIERSGSVAMPSVGEEGAEYSAVADDAAHSGRRSSSPEQTRTIGEDVKLHAPKPSLPAAAAKQQVMAVTRTDSDKAASFGIGRPCSAADEGTSSRNGHRKRPSSSFSVHSDHIDDEHGIPEIGQRVPMNPDLGDVQAPSPAPSMNLESPKKHHNRKLSGRGLPPGSYGLHGHGVAPQDKLEKAYYQKHPELFEREEHTPLHDRQTDFAMSSTDLNKLVRDTASRPSGIASSEHRAIPTEEVAFQASEEYTSRISSRPASAAPAKAVSEAAPPSPTDSDKPIHVDDARHPEFYSCGDEDNANDVAVEEDYKAPILASDEVVKDSKRHLQQPAIHLPYERRSSLQEAEGSPKHLTTRPSSQRSPSYPAPEFGSTPLEDVEEYEPLFSDETKQEKPKIEIADENEGRNHFPSKDVWEDTPSSVHHTALVAAPVEEVLEPTRRRSSAHEDRPITPAQAFAQYQEQLAEKESTFRPNMLPPTGEKANWINHKSHLSPKKLDKPCQSRRFPSRDVWEDTPESLLQETVVSGSPTEEKNAESGFEGQSTQASAAPPAVPGRPKPRQDSGDSLTRSKPPVSDKPKPNVLPRPAKSLSGDVKEAVASKPKPAVPGRVGNKIAALQAGFMSDLNKRLQLGPQAPKKEEAGQEEDLVEEKEKAPLSDARKGRARGPQRRAPAKSASSTTAASPSAPSVPTITLTFAMPQTSWTIDPDDGDINIATESEATPDTGTEAEDYPEPVTASELQADSVQSQSGIVADLEAIDQPIAAVPPNQGPSADTNREEVEQHKHAKAHEPGKVEKTLVANMAVESVLQAEVEKNEDGRRVEPMTVHDDVKP
ncbi:hypothetical protein HIM_06033 [Hirsutella minnesotensis 3608]|uniref:Altered inheritance of mitochondria protein 21 n=1 Tax=Hirsutella minnesotensis 3608 TaxID=1043627 RepID=A0A0F7ZUD7_9HYPO|nr:hypothetical protein HIM_06033 [Hirsutella minnesotensis 3608]